MSDEVAEYHAIAGRHIGIKKAAADPQAAEGEPLTSAEPNPPGEAPPGGDADPPGAAPPGGDALVTRDRADHHPTEIFSINIFPPHVTLMEGGSPCSRTGMRSSRTNMYHD